MPQALARHAERDDFHIPGGLERLVFVPCYLVWLVGLACIAPALLMAIPAQALMERRPELHDRIVTGLVVLTILNVLACPIAAAWYVCA